MSKTLTAGGAIVRSEPATYRELGDRSWFLDLLDARTFGPEGNAAKARLARHGKEQAVELRARRANDERSFDAAIDRLDGRAEKRVNPNNTPGTGGDFDPPLWMTDRYLTAARHGRTLADAVDQAGNLLPLPAGVGSVNIPRIVTGTNTAVTPGNNAGGGGADPTTALASSPVVTIAGNTVASQQLRDLSGGLVDRMLVDDLTKDYDRLLEVQLVNGSGVNGQLLGLANIVGASVVSYTSGTPTLSSMWAPLGQTAAAVANTRGLPPTVALMQGYRSYWAMSSLDSSNRPIASPNTAVPRDPTMAVGGQWASWSALGVPVLMHQGLPTTLGAGGNQDVVLFTRPEDLLLFEGAPRVIIAVNGTAGALASRIALHRYVAFIPHRLPQATASLVGTGLTRPAGF